MAVRSTGVPSEYDNATIMPNTAAEGMLSGLSAATLESRRSMATATRTAVAVMMIRVMPNVKVDMASIIRSAMKV